MVEPSRPISEKPNTSLRIALVLAGALQQQRHAVESADRVLRRHIAIAPAGLVLDAGNSYQRETHTIGISEREHRFAGPLLQRLMGDALFDEPVSPVAERTGRHAEGRLLRLANAAASWRSAFPWEEGKDCSWAAGLVAVIEMIGTGVVEIDRLLDEAKAERAGIKAIVSQAVTGDGSDMMDA